MALNKMLKLAAAVGVVGLVAVGSGVTGFVVGGLFAYHRIEELTKRVTEEHSKRGRSGPYRPMGKKTEMSGISGHVRWYGMTPDEQQIDAVETASELVIRHLGLVDENDKTTEHTKFGLVSYNTTTYGWSVVLERIYDSPVSFAGPRYRITHHHNDNYMTLTEVAKNGDGPSTEYPMDKTELGSDVTSARVRELLIKLSSYEGFEEICDINDISQVDGLVNRLTPIILSNRAAGKLDDLVTDMLALGRRDTDIAKELGITLDSVKARASAVFEKRRLEKETIEKLTNPAVRARLLASIEEDMPLASRTAFAMYCDGKSISDISADMNLSESTVRWRLTESISDKITDLRIAGGSQEELAELVQLSMKVMDEEKVRKLLDSVAQDSENEESDARVDLARRYLDNMVNEGVSPNDQNYAPLEFHGFSTLPGDNWSVLFGVNEGVWRVKYNSKTDELSAVDEGH